MKQNLSTESILNRTDIETIYSEIAAGPISKGEIMERFFPMITTFDYALPQGLVDLVSDYVGEYIAPHFIFNYSGPIFGELFPITRRGAEILRAWYARP